MARRSLPAVLLALALLSPGCQGPETLDRPASPLSTGGVPEVRAILERAVAAERLAGAVALVSHRGEVVAREIVGLRDAEAGAPMRSNTIFRICSMTKPITGTASGSASAS